MRKREIAELKKLLVEQKQRIISSADQTRNQMHERRIIDEPEGDEADMATTETHQNLDLRIRDREGMLLDKIEKALGRIEDGTYGVCDMCGENIDVRRLKARPVATLCISCKQKQEKQEKAFAD